jgi:hypothetical protein
MERIQVRGIGHPVATYRVVDLRAADRAARLRSELPHLKLDADPELMSVEERRQAAAVLQDALQRLAPAAVAPHAPDGSADTDAPPPSGRARQVRSA